MLRPTPPHTQLDMVKGALQDAEEEIACMEKVLQCALMVVRHRSKAKCRMCVCVCL